MFLKVFYCKNSNVKHEHQATMFIVSTLWYAPWKSLNEPVLRKQKHLYSWYNNQWQSLHQGSIFSLAEKLSYSSACWTIHGWVCAIHAENILKVLCFMQSALVNIKGFTCFWSVCIMKAFYCRQPIDNH